MIEFKDMAEALNFAVSKENTASRFYQHLADQQTDELTQQFFLSLAAEEQQHMARLEFELIKMGYTVPLPFGDKKPHVNEIDALDEIPDDMVYAQALQLAIKKEQASFLLYTELLSFARGDIRKLLNQLIEDEIRHKIQFEEVYAQLVGEKDQDF